MRFNIKRHCILNISVILFLLISCSSSEDKSIEKNKEITCSSATYNLSQSELDHFKMKATNGDAESAYKLSQYYYFVKLNMDEGLRWTRMAAESGHALSQYNLAMELIETGSEKDSKQAIYWLEHAAESHYSKAYVKLARLFEEGKVIKKDYSQARSFYEKGALLGDMEAIFILIEYYSDGRKIPKDIVKAYAWIKIAQSRGQNVEIKKLLLSSKLSDSDLKLVDSYYKRLLNEMCIFQFHSAIDSIRTCQ